MRRAALALAAAVVLTVTGCTTLGGADLAVPGFPASPTAEPTASGTASSGAECTPQSARVDVGAQRAGSTHLISFTTIRTGADGLYEGSSSEPDAAVSAVQPDLWVSLPGTPDEWGAAIAIASSGSTNAPDFAPISDAQRAGLALSYDMLASPTRTDLAAVLLAPTITVPVTIHCGTITVFGDVSEPVLAKARVVQVDCRHLPAQQTADQKFASSQC